MKRLSVCVLALSLVLMNCGEKDSNPVNPLGKALDGAWLLAKYTVSLGNVTDSTVFDAQTSSQLLVFGAATVATYSISVDSSTTLCVTQAYVASGDSLRLVSALDTTAYEAAVTSGRLTLWLQDSSGFVWTYEYTRYTGSVPPGHWPQLFVAGDDTYEPDNTPAQATALTIDAAAQQHTLTQGDVDWFSFTAEKGRSYLIETGGATDTYLRLCSADGAATLDSSDAGGLYSNASLFWTAPQSGSFTFSLTGRGTQKIGSYTLTLASVLDTGSLEGSWLLVKSTQTWSSSGQSDFATYTEQTSKLILNVTADTISLWSNDFDATERMALTLTIRGDSLLMGSGAEMISARFSFIGGQLVLQLTEEYPGETSTLREYFAPYSGALPPAHWPDMLQPDAFEPDSAPALATPITAGQSQEHSLTQGDVDWFSLTATAGTLYTLATSGLTDTYLELYDTAATVVLGSNDDASDEDLNALLSWECPQSATYFFKIGGYDADIGAYAVSVTPGAVTKRMAGRAKLRRPERTAKPRNPLMRLLQP